MFDTTRRRTLQALGLGGAASLAGCASTAPTADNTQATTATATEQMSTPQSTDVDRVAADPTDIPDPIDRDSPTEVDVTLRSEEVVAELEDGVTFRYMTYGGQVPGPLIRVRQGDTVNLTFENAESNSLPHNVDFHACAGPGGGAEATTTGPGETAELRFQATYPGGSLSTDPQTHIQTRQVAPGSTTVATMNSPVPGDFKLVDHSLSRVARKGCMAIVRAEGEERPEIFDPEPA